MCFDFPCRVKKGNEQKVEFLTACINMHGLASCS